MNIENFKSILPKYKTIFFDAFGVLKNYNGLLPDIDKTFEYLKEQNQDFYILTNDASRSPKQLAESYHKLGLYAITEDKIISSGMITKEYIDLKVDGGIVAYLGTKNSAQYFLFAKFVQHNLIFVVIKTKSLIPFELYLEKLNFSWRPLKY